MKKHIFTILFFVAQITVVAQTVNIHFKNGQTIEYPSANVDYVDFSAKPSDPTVTAGQAVDLGLSVYWASCNLGAEKPEEFGNYYAWGETKPKSRYSEENYLYYDNNSGNYINIGSDISGTQYDAATINQGSNWRTPTDNEINELIKNCTWEWKQINGTNGYLIMGKNGNSIFLPAAGYKDVVGDTFQPNKYLSYMSSNVRHILVKDGAGPFINVLGDRYFGHTIRPVTAIPSSGDDSIHHSQDYLVTEKISASFTGGSIYSVNGVVQSGSVLNAKFTNGSIESVTLVGVQINDAANGNQGNNVLETETEVAVGESKSFSITLGTNVTTPVVCFTYRYNKKNYKAEAVWNN